MDLNLLTSLDVLLREQSVSQAARRLHLSAPAMSRTLTRAREAFGDALLVRAGRPPGAHPARARTARANQPDRAGRRTSHPLGQPDKAARRAAHFEHPQQRLADGSVRATSGASRPRPGPRGEPLLSAPGQQRHPGIARRHGGPGLRRHWCRRTRNQGPAAFRRPVCRRRAQRPPAARRKDEHQNALPSSRTSACPAAASVGGPWTTRCTAPGTTGATLC